MATQVQTENTPSVSIKRQAVRDRRAAFAREWGGQPDDVGIVYRHWSGVSHADGVGGRK